MLLAQPVTPGGVSISMHVPRYMAARAGRSRPLAQFVSSETVVLLRENAHPSNRLCTVRASAHCKCQKTIQSDAAFVYLALEGDCGDSTIAGKASADGTIIQGFLLPITKTV